jgi:hypothetical protein
MTGLEMFFWIIAAILTAVALIRWWDRAKARAIAAAQEAEETRVYEARLAGEDAEMRKLLELGTFAYEHLHDGPLQKMAVDFTGSRGMSVQCFDDSLRISLFNARGPKADADGAVDIFAPEHTKVIDTRARELSGGDLFAVYLEAMHAHPILGAPDVDSLMDGWRYRYSESELTQIRAMAEEIRRWTQGRLPLPEGTCERV